MYEILIFIFIVFFSIVLRTGFNGTESNAHNDTNILAVANEPDSVIIRFKDTREEALYDIETGKILGMSTGKTFNKDTKA